MDVITPIVDDPFDFGYITAVNALSDIFAMGGIPMVAMSFLAFDTCSLAIEAAALILQGGISALGEAGCALPGDHIYLTKPLGTGIASTALKGEMAPDSLIEGATRWMKTLNRDAAEAAVENGATAMTDVTGFGLLGHLAEMCRAAGIGAEVDLSAVPVMDGIPEMIGMGMVPAGAYDNMKHLEGTVEPRSLFGEDLLPLYDPQTSGGLLIAIPPARSSGFEKGLHYKGMFFTRIGRFSNPGDRILIRR